MDRPENRATEVHVARQERSPTTCPWWWGPSGWVTHTGGSVWLLGRGLTLCPWGTEGKHKSSHPPDGPCLRTDVLRRCQAHPVHLAHLQLESPWGARWDLLQWDRRLRKPPPEAGGKD